MTQNRLPDFIIAGAAKSATTWLQQSLMQSPQILMPSHEPHFFARRYDLGLDAYLTELGAAKTDVLLGEKSNSYLTEPAAAARIHEHMPKLRLIFQLRDPVARAYSDYRMLFRRGEVDGNIDRHLDPNHAFAQRFLSDGLYADHLQRFYDLFDAEQILVLRYEDIATDPHGQLRRVADHIGHTGALAPPLEDRVKDARTATVPYRLRRLLKPLRPLLDPVRDKGPVKKLRNIVARPTRYPPFEPRLKAAVAAFYAPQIDRLAAMTGIDFDIWRQSSNDHVKQ